MPCTELFAAQDSAYRDSLQPPAVRKRLAIEAAVPLGWYRWVGLNGDVVGMTTYGASGPSQEVLKHFGFTIDNVVEHAVKLLAHHTGR